MASVGIYIPTMGRVGLSAQISLREFIQYSHQQVYLVCPLNEESQHLAYHNSVLPHPVHCTHIGLVRQWILEQANKDIVIMSDDDMYFYRRAWPTLSEKGASNPLHRVRNGELDILVDQICDWVGEGFIHGGMSARQGNQNITAPHRDNTRVNNFHFFHRDKFLALGVKFGTMTVMEDFDVTLSLLERGYPNRVSYEYCWNQRRSGAAGGCSFYRTPEIQTDAAHRLARRHPNVVKVVVKNSKSAWGGLHSRTDVNIQWRKAFNV